MSMAAVRGIGVAVITRTSGDVALRPQQVALLDAEPVLLVDHRHAEPRELDASVDQRVGADEDVDLARRAARRRCAAARRRAVRLVSSATCTGRSPEQRALGRAPSAPRATRAW